MHRVRAGVRKAITVAAGGLLVATTMTLATAPAHAATSCGNRATSVGNISGIVHPVSVKTGCAVAPSNPAEPPGGTPPLIWHGGPMMSTASTGPLVVTPIFWRPAGHAMGTGYQNVIDGYLANVAAASGSTTNVFSTLTEYSGSNGTIQYQVQMGTPVSDTDALPASGCQVASNDTTNIYNDNSGYNACLDDNQVIAEMENVVTSQNLPRDLAHIYVMFLPKHVESCFYPGSTLTSANACTINHQPSAAYCAYHSQAPSSAVYANMPFPVYHSPVGYTCGSEAKFPVNESPNHNVDADIEISPTSHEISEAITDPDTSTGWYDSSGFENGDECAYQYGPVSGPTGARYNQTIGTGHYLTQEEFSNVNFALTGRGCLQHS